MSDLTYHSELGEDQWIVDHLPLPEHGYYLDLGCAHPVHNSQTAFLRQLGWSGIGVDANPAYGADWKREVSKDGSNMFICALISCHARVKFQLNHVNPGISRIGEGEVEVPTVTAQSLLDRCAISKLDFLALDLEGHEFEALQSLNLERVAPSIVVTEYSTQGLPPDYRVRDFLLQHGYTLAHTTPSNFVLIRL